ncbi:CHASE2 domain-containing protein [Almyronema epifaneia]|uniref:CHASE2 domain-containing protein n=1 Tax=Almyronema epifaneia S1 TaxID=2991925 RepID=A0ABW6IEQ9_9CYAN
MAFRFLRQQATQAFSSPVIITSLVITGGVILMRFFGVIEGIELGAYDRFIRWKPDEGLDERLLVVGITEEDIQQRQELPIHDGTLADLLVKLESYEPRVIGVDVGRDIPQGPAAGRDRMLEVMQGNENIIVACLLSNPAFPGVPPPEGIADTQVGFAELPQDPGGVVRRSILLSVPYELEDSPVKPHYCNTPNIPLGEDFPLPQESLAFLLSLIYLEGEGIVADQTEYGEVLLGDTVLSPISLTFGGYAYSDAGYDLMLNYRSARNAVEQVSLSDVLNDQVDPDLIRDRIVLIGYTSQVEKDVFVTPYLAAQENLREMTGVVIHAQAASQIISAVLDGRPLIWALPELVEILWIWAWALLGGLIAIWTQRSWQFFLAEGAAVVIGVGLAYLLFLQGGWLPIIPSTLVLVCTALATKLVEQATKGGYTQAIYEQIKEQLRGRSEDSHKRRRIDYLEDLVQRARAIRQGGDTAELAEAESATTLPLDLQNPQMQAIYEQIKAQAEADLLQEQPVTPATAPSVLKEKRIHDLLSRAQALRTPASPPPSAPTEAAAPAAESMTSTDDRNEI